MPLRDHFRPPVEKMHSWDELHGGWPMVIVQQLFPILPQDYVAAPGVHLGAAFEIDVSTYQPDEPAPEQRTSQQNGGVAVAAWSPQPTLTLETELPDQDEYEVRVYDDRHGRRLVAAIEIVSPANKDRPESRRAFRRQGRRPPPTRRLCLARRCGHDPSVQPVCRPSGVGRLDRSDAASRAADDLRGNGAWPQADWRPAPAGQPGSTR